MSYRKFVKDIGIYGTTQLVVALSGIITLPVITKLLGAKSYGIWSQLSITLVMISTVALLGLPYTMVRFLAGEKEKKQIQDGVWSVATIVLALSLVVAGLLVIFSGPISHFFGCDKVYVQILAAIIVFDYINQVFYSVFRATQKVGIFSCFLIFQELGDTALIVLAIYLGYGLWGALLGFLTIRVIIFLLTGGYVVRKIGFARPQFLKTKEYLSFGLPTIPDSISNWVVQSSDRYLIGFFLGTLYVGYYAPAYVIGVFVISFLIAPFSFLLPAVLSKFYDENKIDEVKIYLRYSLKYFLLLAIPSVFGLSILSRQILTIFTNAEIAQAGYIVMPIVALSMVPMGVNAIIAQIIGIVKKTKVGGMLAIAAAVLNFVLNLILIPRFGILGAAITTLIAYTFILMLMWAYSFKHLTFDIDWIFVLKSIFASLLMTLFVSWLQPTGFYATMGAILAGVVIYLALILLLKSFSKEEVELFKKVVKNNV